MKEHPMADLPGPAFFSSRAADFTPAKKPCVIRRREITVSLVGEFLAMPPANGKREPEEMIAYWIAAMDREIPNRPDLVVLPEHCDNWGGDHDFAQHWQWLARRGAKVLDAFRNYARKHQCYLVYPAHRLLEDGKIANSSILIDRDGDVIAVYDKNYPTVGEIDSGVVPGSRPVVTDTDFGRLGLMICFDLNFWELMDQYARLKPDVLAFSSYCDGGCMRQAWAMKCRAWLLGCVVGSLPKTITGPSGEIVRREQSYFRTITGHVNTNCAVVHLDFNFGSIQAAVNKYGQMVAYNDPGLAGMVTLYSRDPSLPIEDILREFDIATWDEYYRRSVDARNAALA